VVWRDVYEGLDEMNIFTREGAKILVITFLGSFVFGVGVGILGLCLVIDALAK
jgi:hypothetical protein